MRPPAGVSVWHQVQCSRLLAPCTPSSRLARSQNVRATVYILAAPATASAADATSSGPVSTTAVHSGESSKASVLDQGLVHQAHDNTTIKQRRRSRKETSLLANTPADVQSDQNHTQTAEQQQQHRRRKNAKQTPPAVDDALVQTLISRTQLSQAAAQKIAAAKARGYGIPRDISKLCSNVQQLQQMLGAEYADLAITRFPSLVAYSPATLAFNLRQWQAFFGTNDPPGMSSSPIARQLLAARQQALLRKLARQPQLLGVNVEKQVANLYDIGVILGEQDMHTFAYKAMELGTKGADSLQEKLLRVLAVLNSQPHDQQQQQQQPQLPQLPSQQQPDPQLQQQPDQQLSEQAQQLSEQAQQQPSQQQQQQEGHDPMQPAIEASAAAGSNTPHYFSLSDVQAAARVNPQWLTLSADTLEARLVGIQQALEIPMSAVGRMFLRSPSLLNKRPATLAAKASALKALPGLQAGQAAAMMAAMPSLLNLDPQRVASRWQRLQQAADSHPMWRAALDVKPASSLANLLIRSEARYTRLPGVIAARLQHVLPLPVVLNTTDQDFERRAAKARAVLQARAVLHGDGPDDSAAAAVGPGGSGSAAAAAAAAAATSGHGQQQQAAYMQQAGAVLEGDALGSSAVVKQDDAFLMDPTPDSTAAPGSTSTPLT